MVVPDADDAPVGTTPPPKAVGGRTPLRTPRSRPSSGLGTGVRTQDSARPRPRGVADGVRFRHDGFGRTRPQGDEFRPPKLISCDVSSAIAPIDLPTSQYIVSVTRMGETTNEQQENVSYGDSRAARSDIMRMPDRRRGRRGGAVDHNGSRRNGADVVRGVLRGQHGLRAAVAP